MLSLYTVFVVNPVKHNYTFKLCCILFLSFSKAPFNLKVTQKVHIIHCHGKIYIDILPNIKLRN